MCDGRDVQHFWLVFPTRAKKTVRNLRPAQVRVHLVKVA